MSRSVRRRIIIDSVANSRVHLRSVQSPMFLFHLRYGLAICQDGLTQQGCLGIYMMIGGYACLVSLVCDEAILLLLA